MRKINAGLLLMFSFMILSYSCNSQPVRLFASRFTQAGEKGFYIYDLNPEAGKFTQISEADAGPNPSYFCISRKYGKIYAANEVMNFNGVKGGGITTLKYNDRSGAIEKLSDLVVPFGGPCFISLSPGEDFLLLANYSSSSISVVKLNSNGLPEKVTDTIQFKGNDGAVSHPHMIAFDRAGKNIYLTDLGLDQIVIYNLDPSSGQLRQIQNGIVNLPKGTGPRHFVFSDDGKKMYVICELNSTVSVFDVNSKGELSKIQTLSTTAPGYAGTNACADIHIGKTGEFLYGSNRGENTIVTFRIESDGKLSFAGCTTCGGDWPRNFVLDPTGKFLLAGNQKSGNISIFRIDEQTGIPIAPGKDQKLATPACLKFIN